jgi:hypothetical protein
MPLIKRIVKTHFGILVEPDRAERFLKPFSPFCVVVIAEEVIKPWRRLSSPV